MQALTSIVGVWLAAFLTLSIFSFLFKDNPLYKLAEHLVVGVSAGYTAVVYFDSTLLDKVYDPLKADLTNGGPFVSAERFGQLLIDLTPCILGLLMWTRLSPKLSWIGRTPLALFLGVGSGLAVPTYIQTYVVQSLRATLLPIVPTSWTAALGALVGAAGPASRNRGHRAQGAVQPHHRGRNLLRHRLLLLFKEQWNHGEGRDGRDLIAMGSIDLGYTDVARLAARGQGRVPPPPGSATTSGG
jgi:hypothetical protein